MTEKFLTKNALSVEFEKNSTHSVPEISRALAAYRDPNNPHATNEALFQTLMEALIGDGSGTYDNDDMRVNAAMWRIFGELKDARHFNDKYIGHLLTEASTPGFMGAFMSLLTGSNTVAREVSLAESRLEPEALDFLKEIVGYDVKESSGTFATGGSTAMLTALAVAQELMHVRAEEEGKRLDPRKPALVLANRMAHYSAKKMCMLLGGPYRHVQFEPVGTRNLRMSPDDLKKKLEDAKKNGVPVMAIIAIAGETELGLVDPLDKIADLADEHKVPLIVDGAYGAPYNLSRAKDKFKGLGRAFAIPVDGHKALNTSYENGAVLFRRAEDHAWLNVAVEAPYLGGSADIDRTKSLREQRKQKHEEMVRKIRAHEEGLGDKRIEGSMGAGSILSTLAVARTLGKEGMATILNLTLDRINYLYKRIENEEKSPYLMPLHKPDLALLCFKIRDNIKTQLNLHSTQMTHEFITRTRTELDKGIVGEGGYFFSETEIENDKGKREWVYRACVMSERTTNDILDDAVDGLEAIIKREIKKVEENKASGDKTKPA